MYSWLLYCKASQQGANSPTDMRKVMIMLSATPFIGFVTQSSLSVSQRISPVSSSMISCRISKLYQNRLLLCSPRHPQRCHRTWSFGIWWRMPWKIKDQMRESQGCHLWEAHHEDDEDGEEAGQVLGEHSESGALSWGQRYLENGALRSGRRPFGCSVAKNLCQMTTKFQDLYIMMTIGPTRRKPRQKKRK